MCVRVFRDNNAYDIIERPIHQLTHTHAAPKFNDIYAGAEKERAFWNTTVAARPSGNNVH